MCQLGEVEVKKVKIIFNDCDVEQLFTKWNDLLHHITFCICILVLRF